MTVEYGVRTKNRPNLVKDMRPGDVLHVGTEEKGEIFTVTKVGNREFILKQTDHEIAYAHSRGVMNQKIMDFQERYDVYFIITKGDLEELGLVT